MPTRTESDDVRAGALNSDVESNQKKPYRSPRVFVYGDFRRLTATKGGAKNDGGGVPNSKA